MSTLAIVFSLDRALQLESLLRSMDDLCFGLSRVVVLWNASTKLHEDAYTHLRSAQRKTQVVFVRDDQRLGQILGEVVEGAPETFLALHVDDQVYFRSSDFGQAEEVLGLDAFVWSWRLGRAAFCETNEDEWRVRLGDTIDRDYSYLWHSDGAVYDRQKWLNVLNHINPTWREHCTTPNAVESMAATTRVGWPPGTIHAGPLQATTMTWQLNKETTTEGKYGAPWCVIPETELDALAEAFLAGKRVNNERLYADKSWTRKFQVGDSARTHVRACAESSRFFAGLIK